MDDCGNKSKEKHKGIWRIRKENETFSPMGIINEAVADRFQLKCD